MACNPEDRLSHVDAHLSVCLNSRVFLIVLNKITISGDKFVLNVLNVDI